MNKQKIFIILIPILCLLLATISYLKISNVNGDSIKFKKEYESLNGKESLSGKAYKELKISENNPMKYSNYDELLDIIKNKTGIIYLGFPSCPWCRSALPVLLDVAKDKKIDTIYYLNIENERDFYVVENDELVYALDESGVERKGTKGYFELMEALEDNLSDYILTIDGKNYEVGEKRIYAPSFIFVLDGNILGIHVSTVESHIDEYEPLTQDQYDELYSIFEDYISELSNSSCYVGTSC